MQFWGEGLAYNAAQANNRCNNVINAPGTYEFSPYLDDASLLLSGTNVLAVYAGTGYDQENFEPIVQFDLYIEGLNTSIFK